METMSGFDSARKDAILNMAEELGWSFLTTELSNGTYVEFNKHSDAGEDFSFSVEGATSEDIVDGIIDYADDFDAEEHAAAWFEVRGTYGVPDSLRVLLDDADSIKDGLMALSQECEHVFDTFEIAA